VLAAVIALGLLAACGSDDTGAKDSSAKDSTAGTELVGLFAITPAACAGATPTGSYFKMVQPGGTVDAGPFLANADSTCATPEVTPLGPGTDGGLRTGAYQPLTEPNFDAKGSTTALSIISSTSFFAVGFGMSTNAVDPQTKEKVDPPTLSAADGKLTGDLSSVSVSWNGQHFNQGSPRPGSNTSEHLTGTYDAGSGAYTLEWTSLISGGPFDGFTGIWHLEGTFTAS
jgi:hypothetical protein